ncbi:MAG: dTMP kinase [Magnetococcales bacterium]|nr:dTMP kinase [Magnetococcales bacterium]
MPGRFITFEGGEGGGKSSQLLRLAKRLRERGIGILCSREPGGTELAEEIRKLLVRRSGADSLAAETEWLLVTAARFEHVRRVIRPALQEGSWVLCDRFFDSTLAYQGFGRGLNTEMLQRLQTMLFPDLRPDLTLLLDVSPEVGLARSRGGEKGEDRFETESLLFHQRVRQGFLTLAAEESRRIRVIDAALSEEQVSTAIWQQVTDVFLSDLS